MVVLFAVLNSVLMVAFLLLAVIKQPTSMIRSLLLVLRKFTNVFMHSLYSIAFSVLQDENAGREGDLYIRSVSFSPDGKYLATGAEDKQIRVCRLTHTKHVRFIYSCLDLGYCKEAYSRCIDWT